jgi:hypothetical protein
MGVRHVQWLCLSRVCCDQRHCPRKVRAVELDTLVVGALISHSCTTSTTVKQPETNVTFA